MILSLIEKQKNNNDFYVLLALIFTVLVIKIFIVFFTSIPTFVMLSLKIDGYLIAAEFKAVLFWSLEKIFGYALNLNEVLGPIKNSLYLFLYFVSLFIARSSFFKTILLLLRLVFCQFIFTTSKLLFVI
ncbi:hypothetical protein BAPKO_0892 [Borreliella afzelii PKo]|nr:hypothetical protein BAPKO_0892 [Borreliella afzelii PKo]